MKKMLRTSDKILSVLALFGDIAIEGYSRGHGFGRNRSWSEALSVKNSTFRRELNRFLKTGDIEKIVDKKGNVAMRLTTPGKKKVERIFPLIKLSSKKWDEKWRVVIFDIEEKQKKSRESLRRKLLSLGFGKLQESVYITPLDILFDINEYLKNENLFGNVLVFEAKDLLGFDPKMLANNIWHLEKINCQYQDIIFEMKEAKEKNKKENIKKKYFDILLKDPILPKEFLPNDWLGYEIKKIFVE